MNRAGRLARLSANEMVTALGLGRPSLLLRATATLPLWAASVPLGQTLARFDEDITRTGLSGAAARALSAFHVRVIVHGNAPATGPLLVLSNHPGAHDALALMAALQRDDLLILAGDRTFLRELPALARHLAFLPDTPRGRAAGLKQALRHLRAGGSVLHFPAGRIEPDPEFVAASADLLGTWTDGTGVLVRAAEKASGSLVVAGVRGVHSARAKRFVLTRAAERRGVTTFALLIQIAARLRDVGVHVQLGAAHAAGMFCGGDDHRRITDRARNELLHRLSSPPPPA